MDGATTTTMENTSQQNYTDPWEAAFAAINKETTQAPETTTEEHSNTNTINNGSQVAEESNGNTDSNGIESNENTGVQNNAGRPDNSNGVYQEAYDDGDQELFNISSEEIDSIRQSIKDEAEETAIREIAQEFIRRGVRHNNGMLGASINDPDIMKKDSDGVPSFYNPDTGREFTGDNPRRQAIEWCEDYNRELAKVFNQACDKRVSELVKESDSRLQVLEFAPTYNNLDQIRRQMFDSIIEDYEVKDADGNAIGYSIDLNKALQTVNRQVQMIQEYSRMQQHQKEQQQDQPKEKSQPALDMRQTSGTNTGNSSKPKFNSVAEAMEYLQNQQINKEKK